MGELDGFVLEFPRGVDPAAVTSLRTEIASLDGVKRTGSGATRSLDAATLTAWVTLAGAAIPVITQLRDLFRRHKVKGVKVKLANGTTLDIDEISSDDLKTLLAMGE